MIPISIVVTHFVGDFLLQSNWMALGKSKQWVPLLTHCLVYALCFIWWGWQFAALTFLTHLITDYCTSRLTSKLWFVKGVKLADPAAGTGIFKHVQHLEYVVDYDMSKRHWFFVALGADQLIHMITLTLTYGYLF